jgi:hypothetical protein
MLKETTMLGRQTIVPKITAAALLSGFSDPSTTDAPSIHHVRRSCQAQIVRIVLGVFPDSYLYTPLVGGLFARVAVCGRAARE